MILKRRDKESLISKVQNLIWPKMGWRRVFHYYKHRILRLPHSTHDIAMGLASGCVVSWTPTFPFQILQCFIFCKVVKANFPAALLGTVFGNPWTFPILFTIAYQVGQYVLNITEFEDFLMMMAGGTEIFAPDSFGVQKFLPTLVGGYILAVVTFPMFYYVFYYLVTAGRASRRVVSKKVHTIIEHHHEKKRKEEK